MITRRIYVSLVVAALCASTVRSSFAQTAPTDASFSSMGRCEQAEKLKGMADEFVKQANEFHKTADLRIAEAKKLTGQASYLQSRIVAPSVPLKLTASQRAAAMSQYKGDLTQFMMHAKAYEDHTNHFDQQLGRCHATESMYEQNLKQYEMHLQSFHLPNLGMPDVGLSSNMIRPPHICAAMVVSEGEASSIVGHYLSDQARVLQAEQQLESAEASLKAARAGSSVADAKVETAIARGEREKALAMEFGRLRQEYDVLMIEHNALAGINAKGAFPAARGVSSTKVHGSLIH